ncbi:motility associated factor glycosyltransferase family protein [Clostridium manihotivorum]|uniref:6-hydroxymethylpterin diphosphokinase MptE-like domain-containing protein n=1 Tax=Clostridium manihotivorum TaxID=2320868 RepID=A0A410DRH0_9CLOT|nr:6-hydroxymethylpterin diphosphokinase MptE-like protein [Clostridium manihotivorum]QAA31657.1 hypothetical protein C1I91_08365 [Clostridium manihotivorum]
MIIEKSFDNKEIIKLEIGSRKVYLGSKYNMTREVEKFKNALSQINKHYQVIVFGAAGGTWISEVQEEFKEREVLFVEPLDELKEQLSKNISEFNNIQVISLESDNFQTDLKKAINKRFVQFLVFSNYDLIFPKEGYDLKNGIKDDITDKTINENTKVVFSKDWFKNYLKNLPVVTRSERLDKYKSIFSKKPAIIVSAGPSLEKNVQLLKGNEDKFIIITGIRTLSTLKKEGIKADFACVIDGSEAMYNVSKDALNEETPLFFSESANYKIMREYKGKKLYFTSPNYIDLNIKLGNFSTDLVYQGGSVAHSCLAIAEYFDCDPIVFIGQDLAYTNNQIHSKNATIKGEQLKADNFDFYVKDIYGNDVPTTYSLDSFRKNFEDFIKCYNERTYINATEGGANIEGTLIKTLKEVIDESNSTIDKSCIYTYDRPDINTEIMLNELKNNFKELLKLKRFAKEAILENDNLVHNYSTNNKRFKKGLERLDYIDNLYKEKKDQFLLINSLFAPIIKEIDVQFYDEKVGNYESELEHVKFIAEKGKSLYNNVEECIDFAAPYINDAIKALEGIISE